MISGRPWVGKLLYSRPFRTIDPFIPLGPTFADCSRFLHATGMSETRKLASAQHLKRRGKLFSFRYRWTVES